VHGVSVFTRILPITSLKEVILSWPILTSFLGNSYFFVILTTLLTIFLIGVFLIIKYLPLAFNDLKTFTNNEMPDTGLKLWLAFIFIIPLFLDAGPMLFTLWWFVLLWGYMIKSERRIAFFFVFLILMSSWIAHVGGGFVTYTKSQLNREIFATEHDLGSADDINAIATWIKAYPEDAEPINTMALIEINKSDFADAAKHLEQSIDLEPSNARYFNHLGIALVGSGKQKEATKAFQNAIDLMPDNMVYDYNISRLYQSNFNFYEAEKFIKKASNIDPERVRYLLDAENTDSKSKYIEEHVPAFRQIARQMRPSADLKAAADALWSMAFGMIPRKMSVFMAIGAFFIFFFQGYIPEDKFSKSCCRCGKLYYSGTITNSGNPICLQCHWLETKTKKQQNKTKIHKTEEIRKYKSYSYQRLAKLELILPGLGMFLINKTGSALARIAVWSVSILLIITGGGFITSFIPIGMEMSLTFRFLGLVVLGMLLVRTYKYPPIMYGV
jgi:tetratricopeptide (TPR) repeat protein